MRKLILLAVITAIFLLMTTMAVAETAETPKSTTPATTQATGEFGVFFTPMTSSECSIEQSSFQVFYTPETIVTVQAPADAPILLTEKEMAATHAP